MRAFSYAWSLPVMWQRWRSRHSIRHNRKPDATRTLAFYLLQNRNHRWSKFYIARIGIFSFLAPVTLTLTQWPSYTKVTRIPGWAKMNLLRHYNRLIFDRVIWKVKRWTFFLGHTVCLYIIIQPTYLRTLACAYKYEFIIILHYLYL